MNRRVAWLVSAGLLVAAVGCRRGADLSPPQIAYGETECELCKMMVSEEPFAAAAVVDSPSGLTKLAFDDIGCLVRFAQEHSAVLRAVYVHDFGSQQWVSAETAHYVHSPKLRSPMASNLAPFADAASAEPLRAKLAGTMVTWTQLLEPGGTLATGATEIEESHP